MTSGESPARETSSNASRKSSSGAKLWSSPSTDENPLGTLALRLLESVETAVGVTAYLYENCRWEVLWSRPQARKAYARLEDN